MFRNWSRVLTLHHAKLWNYQWLLLGLSSHPFPHLPCDEPATLATKWACLSRASQRATFQTLWPDQPGSACLKSTNYLCTLPWKADDPLPDFSWFCHRHSCLLFLLFTPSQSSRWESDWLWRGGSTSVCAQCVINTASALKEGEYMATSAETIAWLHTRVYSLVYWVCLSCCFYYKKKILSVAFQITLFVILRLASAPLHIYVH